MCGAALMSCAALTCACYVAAWEQEREAMLRQNASMKEEEIREVTDPSHPS